MVAPAFFESWEDGTFDKWSTIIGNPWVIITDPVKCGVKAIWCDSVGGEIYHSLNASPDIQHFQFFIRIVPNPDEPPTGVGGGVLFMVEFTDNTFIQLYVLTGQVPNKPSLFLCTDFGVHNCYGTTGLNSDQWYCIEIRIETNKNGATQQVYIDGVLECSFTVDLPSRNFYRAYFNSFWWSFGRDCRVVVDCYGYYDEDTYLNCLCADCTEAGYSEPNDDVVIDSEPYDCIAWRERQTCKVAVRNIPLRTTGSFVDTGTYTLRNRRLYITVRLTDAKKTTLKTTFDGRIEVTITTRGWTYTGWFVTKPLVYEYSKDGDGDEREWIAELEFTLSSFSYSP